MSTEKIAAAGNKSAVVFDFDGTLTTTDSIKFLLCCLLFGSPRRVFKALLLIIKHKGTPQDMKAAVIGCLVKNRSVDAINRNLSLFHWMVKKYLRRNIFHLLEKHLNNGDLVIIATASPSFAIADLFRGRSLRVEGTEFLVEKGRFTGEIESMPCYGKQKAERIRVLMEKERIDRLIVAYSDHFSDLPLLRCAEKAVFVSPDRKTRQFIKIVNASVIE